MDLTKEEFFAYMLLYAAFADFIEASEQREYILTKVDKKTYKRVHKIFDRDNDAERIETILRHVKAHNYNQANPEELLLEVQNTMKSDGIFDAAEQACYIGLKRLIQNA